MNKMRSESALGERKGEGRKEEGRMRGVGRENGGKNKGESERELRNGGREREYDLRLSVSLSSTMILALGLKSACWISTQN